MLRRNQQAKRCTQSLINLAWVIIKSFHSSPRKISYFIKVYLCECTNSDENILEENLNGKEEIKKESLDILRENFMQ